MPETLKIPTPTSGLDTTGLTELSLVEQFHEKHSSAPKGVQENIRKILDEIKNLPEETRPTAMNTWKKLGLPLHIKAEDLREDYAS